MKKTKQGYGATQRGYGATQCPYCSQSLKNHANCPYKVQGANADVLANDAMEEATRYRIDHAFIGQLNNQGFWRIWHILDTPGEGVKYCQEVEALCSLFALNYAYRTLPDDLRIHDREGHAADITEGVIKDLRTAMDDEKKKKPESLSAIIIGDIREFQWGPQRAKMQRGSESAGGAHTQVAMKKLSDEMRAREKELGRKIYQGDEEVLAAGPRIDTQERAEGRKPQREWWIDWKGSDREISFDIQAIDEFHIAEESPTDQDSLLADYTPQLRGMFMMMDTFDAVVNAHATQVSSLGDREMKDAHQRFRLTEVHRRNVRAQPSLKRLRDASQWATFIMLRSEQQTGETITPSPGTLDEPTANAMKKRYRFADNIAVDFRNPDSKLYKLFGARSEAHKQIVSSIMSELPSTRRVDAIQAMIALSSASRAHIAEKVLDTSTQPQEVLDMVYAGHTF